MVRLLWRWFGSGSSESYLSKQFAKSINVKLSPSSHEVTMASSSLVRSIGSCNVTLRYNDSTYTDVKLIVLPDLCADVILGHDFLRLHNSLVISFEGKRPILRLCSLATANVSAPPLFANLSADCRPIAIKSRRYSDSDAKFISQEVKKLLDEGIIERSNSPWRAQVLVTTNERPKKCLVIDYSQTINRFTQLDAYPLPRITDMVEEIAQYKIFSTLDLRSAYHQIPILQSERQYTAFEADRALYQFRRIPFGVTNGVACFQRTMDEIIKTEHLDGTFAYIDNITICGHSQEEHDSNLQKFKLDSIMIKASSPLNRSTSLAI